MLKVGSADSNEVQHQMTGSNKQLDSEVNYLRQYKRQNSKFKHIWRYDSSSKLAVDFTAFVLIWETSLHLSTALTTQWSKGATALSAIIMWPPTSLVDHPSSQCQNSFTSGCTAWWTQVTWFTPLGLDPWPVLWRIRTRQTSSLCKHPVTISSAGIAPSRFLKTRPVPLDSL